MSQQLLQRASAVLAARTSRRGFLARTAVVGSALAVNPFGYLLKPGTAYASVCGDGADCGAGWTAFCCTVNNGVNACPPGTFVGGWWKADNSSFCCGSGARYYVDCQNECTGCASGCGGYNSFCNSGCIDGSCHCAGGSCDQRRVSCNYFRYGQCHQEIGCAGPVACRVITCTPPYELWDFCGTASATDDNTATHSAPCLPGQCLSAVDQHWWDIGGPGAPVGQPVTGELVCPDGAGHYRHYQNGSIYWSPATGAWEVQGLIRDRWSALGWETGVVGYPVHDERPATGGRWSDFQRGVIYWSPPAGAHEVHGAILGTWSALGRENGFLGYPTSDEYGVPGGRASNFRGGAVFWSGPTGAQEVHGLILAHYGELSGPASALGLPTTGEYGVPGGRASSFQHGRICWSPATGPHAVQGAIDYLYGVLGGPGSFLGLPTSDEQAVTGGRVSTFAGGRAYWSASTGAHEVHGDILGRYLAAGGPDSGLGLPVRDEYGVPGGRASDFAGATVYWRPADRVTFAVAGAARDKYLALGGPGSVLGPPVADTAPVGGLAGSTVTTCQAGRIYAPSTPATPAAQPAHEVHGDILGRYLAVGGPTGRLGLPTSDEQAAPGGRRSDFEHGVIFWDAASRQTTVSYS